MHFYLQLILKQPAAPKTTFILNWIIKYHKISNETKSSHSFILIIGIALYEFMFLRHEVHSSFNFGTPQPSSFKINKNIDCVSLYINILLLLQSLQYVQKLFADALLDDLKLK